MEIDDLKKQEEARFAELISFVRNQIGEHNMSITRDTLIEDDLGVSGDDADDLIISFGDKYQVDIKKFNFSKYFNDEPSIFDTGRQVYPLTVGHLEKAIIAGRLDEEIINS